MWAMCLPTWRELGTTVMPNSGLWLWRLGCWYRTAQKPLCPLGLPSLPARRCISVYRRFIDSCPTFFRLRFGAEKPAAYDWNPLHGRSAGVLYFGIAGVRLGPDGRLV